MARALLLNDLQHRTWREILTPDFADIGILDLAQVEPVHVAAFVELQLKLHSKLTVKVRLAALRMLFEDGGRPGLPCRQSGARAKQACRTYSGI
jgi:hypothetical protein